VAAPWVLEPSPAATVTALVDVLGDLDAHRRAARAAAGSVRDAFSWDAAAQAIEQLAANDPVSREAVGEPMVTVPGRSARPRSVRVPV
jgi:hypothetical protein